ncbi:MAG: peptidylprolyl isomerase [Gammaproteobacteria bacterium]
MNSRTTRIIHTNLSLPCLLLTALLLPSLSAAAFYVRVQTDLGSFDIELFDTVAPLTVANFMNYVNDGDYDGTFIHRSAPDFVLQMGGYIFEPDQGDFFGDGTSQIPTDPPVINEFWMSNIRGTIAMAKSPGDPNSATSEFFINLADNSENLDNQNGGFTVFAQVIDGMDVIDSIVGEQRCSSYFIFNTGKCNGLISFDDSPLLNMLVNDPLFPTDFLNDVAPENLVKIISIGVDIDGDSVIDRVEDAGPNKGDGNGDGIPDKQQANVSSLVDVVNGGYVTVETEPNLLLKNLSITDGSYILLQSDSNKDLSGLNFTQGFLGFEVKNVVPGGDVMIKIHLAEGERPIKYFKFGPTPDNPVDHLYEFGFDGETGAEFSGNVVILHFVDGKRGDSDLTANGVIVDPGTPAIRAGNTGGNGGGGGCSMAEHHSGSERSGDWLLLALCVLVLGLYRKAYR